MENISSFESEKQILKNTLSYQNLIKRSLLKYIDEIATNSIDNFNSTAGELAYNYLNNVRATLPKVDENIESLTSLIKQLDDSLSEDDNSYMQRYIECFKKISSNTLEIQTVLNNLLDYVEFDFSTSSRHDILNTDIILNAKKESNAKNTKIIPIDSKEPVLKECASSNVFTQFPFKENELVISDVQNKVVLPFNKVDVENIYDKNAGKYSSLQDVVDDVYTLPMSYFKNANLTRFKEAYTLVRKKSNGSVKDALDLGLELFFNYDLNPAIITACNNVDELDIYLACLESNDLDGFNCFSISYEALPTVQKKQKKNK